MEDIASEIVKKFTDDQKYMYRAWKAVTTGVLPVDFEKYEVGKLHQARKGSLLRYIFPILKKFSFMDQDMDLREASKVVLDPTY